MTEEKHDDVTVTDNAEDLIPDVPAITLDDIETFDQKVEKHDEVGEEGTDGDESEAAPEPKAEADAPVNEPEAS